MPSRFSNCSHHASAFAGRGNWFAIGGVCDESNFSRYSTSCATASRSRPSSTRGRFAGKSWSQRRTARRILGRRIAAAAGGFRNGPCGRSFVGGIETRSVSRHRERSCNHFPPVGSSRVSCRTPLVRRTKRGRGGTVPRRSGSRTEPHRARPAALACLSHSFSLGSFASLSVITGLSALRRWVAAHRSGCSREPSPRLLATSREVTESAASVDIHKLVQIQQQFAKRGRVLTAK